MEGWVLKATFNLMNKLITRREEEEEEEDSAKEEAIIFWYRSRAFEFRGMLRPWLRNMPRVPLV